MASERSYHSMSISLVFGVCALGDLLFGYEIGATSYAVVVMKHLNYSPEMIGAIVSAPSQGALVSSFAVFAYSDKIGRRAELRIAALCFLVGAIVESCSGKISESAQTGQFILYLIGRYIYGTGIAFGLHGSTTYVGEMVPSQVRGVLQSLQETSLVFGILLGYLMGSVYSSRQSWAPLYASSLVASGSMCLLTVLVIPDSARWLFWKGRIDAAEQSLKFIYPEEQAAKELQQLQSLQNGQNETTSVTESTHLNSESTVDSIQSTGEETPEVSSTTTEEIQTSLQQNSTLSSNLLDPVHRPALRAGLGLIALLQLTGQPTILSYAASLLQQSGLNSSSTFWVAVFKFLVTLLAASLVERLGRKPMLYVGCGLMLVSLTILMVTTFFGGHSLLLLVALGGYIAGYNIGFGTLCWLLSSEVFPMSIRGPAVALSVQLNFFLHSIMEAAVPILQEKFGWSSIFGMFGVATAYSIYFFYLYLPETKGLTLEEIESKFQQMVVEPRTNEEIQPIMTADAVGQT